MRRVLQRSTNWVRGYYCWLGQIGYESVVVANAVFAFFYGLRLLLLQSFFSYPTETVIVLLSQNMPILPIAVGLIVGSMMNLVAVYTRQPLFFAVSLYWLLFIWLLLLLGFVPTLGWSALHTLIAFYLIMVYAWVLWRIRGLSFLSSP